MIVRVSDIESEGLTLANVGEFGTAFADRSWRLDRIRLHLERDGDDVVVTGEIQATVPLVCGRCLEPFTLDALVPVDVRYAPRPVTGHAVELGVDDLDMDFYQNDQLDVSALVETETSLAVPMKPLCRPDCQGLCTTCGANRNTTTCGCAVPAPDPRLGALRDLASRLSR